MFHRKNIEEEIIKYQEKTEKLKNEIETKGIQQGNSIRNLDRLENAIDNLMKQKEELLHIK